MRKVLLITLSFLVLLLIALSVPTGYYILSSKNILPSGEGNIVYQTGKNILATANNLTGQSFLSGSLTAEDVEYPPVCLHQKVYKYNPYTGETVQDTRGTPYITDILVADVIGQESGCHKDIKYCGGQLLGNDEICQIGERLTEDIWNNNRKTSDFIGTSRTCLEARDTSEGKKIINITCTDNMRLCKPVESPDLQGPLNPLPVGERCYFEATTLGFDLGLNPALGSIATTTPIGGNVSLTAVSLAGLLAVLIPNIVRDLPETDTRVLPQDLINLVPYILPGGQPDPELEPQRREVPPLLCIPFVNCPRIPLPEGAPPEDPVCPQGTIREGDFCLNPLTREQMGRIITAASVAGSSVLAALNSVSIPGNTIRNPAPMVVELLQAMRRKITQTTTQDEEEKYCNYYDGQTTQRAPVLREFLYPITTQNGVKKTKINLASRLPINPEEYALGGKRILQEYITFAQTDWAPLQFCYVIAPLYQDPERNVGATFSSRTFPYSVAIDNNKLTSDTSLFYGSLFHEFVHFYDDDYLHKPYLPNPYPVNAFSEGRAQLGEFLIMGGKPGGQFVGSDTRSSSIEAQNSLGYNYGWQNLAKPNLSNELHKHPPEPTRALATIFILMSTDVEYLIDPTVGRLESTYKHPLDDWELSEIFSRLITNNQATMFPQQEGPSLAEAPIDIYGDVKLAPSSETVTTNTFSTKACIYSQLDSGVENCYWGNCDDTTKNCGSTVNDNCKYVEGKSTGEKLASCPQGDTSNLTPENYSSAQTTESSGSLTDAPCIYQQAGLNYSDGTPKCFVGRCEDPNNCGFNQGCRYAGEEISVELESCPGGSKTSTVCIYPEGAQNTQCFYGLCNKDSQASGICKPYTVSGGCVYEPGITARLDSCPTGTQDATIPQAQSTSTYTCSSLNLAYINIGVGDSSGGNVQNFKNLNCAQGEVVFESNGDIKTSYDLPSNSVANQVYTIIAYFHYQDGTTKEAKSQVVYKPNPGAGRRNN